MAKDYLENYIFEIMEENSSARPSYTRSRYPPVPGRVVPAYRNHDQHIEHSPIRTRSYQGQGASHLTRPKSADYSVIQQSIGGFSSVGSHAFSENNGCITVRSPTSPSSARNRQMQHIGRSSTSAQLCSPDCDCPAQSHLTENTDASNSSSSNGGVMHHVKQKLSNNIEHYSNMLQDIALPMFLRRSGREKKGARSRSGSRNRSRHQSEEAKVSHRSTTQDHNRNSVIINERVSPIDALPAESIELHHMGGFVFGSEKEKGKGHHFVLVQLKNPTWCDKCMDFIWGVYKQCLQCQRYKEFRAKKNDTSIWFVN